METLNKYSSNFNNIIIGECYLLDVESGIRKWTPFTYADIEENTTLSVVIFGEWFYNGDLIIYEDCFTYFNRKRDIEFMYREKKNEHNKSI